MESAVDAFNHFHFDLETVEDYGDRCGANYLFTWDDGGRVLYRCKKCGGYVLVQRSDIYDRTGDSFYACFFPVSGSEEAAELNRQYDGYRIEREFEGNYIIKRNLDQPTWRER